MVLQLFFARIFGLPFWWYGRGLMLVIKRLGDAVSSFSANIGIRVWAKNLLVPMYGDASLSGRAISFIVRLAMVAVRSVGIVAYTLLLFFVFIVYIALPPLVVIGFIYHLSFLLIVTV